MTKDLKRLGYEATPRGSTKELRNRGPGEGIGLITKEKSDDDKKDNQEVKLKGKKGQQGSQIEEV